MSTQVESSTQTQPDPSATADPIDQAQQLVSMLSRGLGIHQSQYANDGDADDRTLVLAAVGIAIAHHISRVADALEQRNQPLPF